MLSLLLASGATLQPIWLAKTFRLVERQVASSETVKERRLNQANTDNESFSYPLATNQVRQANCNLRWFSSVDTLISTLIEEFMQSTLLFMPLNGCSPL